MKRHSEKMHEGAEEESGRRGRHMHKGMKGPGMGHTQGGDYGRGGR